MAPPLLGSDPSPSSVQIAPPSDVGPLTTDELKVDISSKEQVISGLGINADVHSWKNGQLKPAIDRYTALGPVTWRVIIEKADWEPTQVGSPDVIDEEYYRRIYETPKMQDLWNTIAYIEASPNQTVSLSVMGGVAPWMGGTQILPEKEDYWVRMIASLLDYARNQKGLRLSLVSPLNEPDWDGIEGAKVKPSQMTELLSKLSRKLDSMGMGDVRFVVPDAASVQNIHASYLPALLADPTVAAKIARIGIHTYSGDAGAVPDDVAKSSKGGTPVWATEFNATCDTCDSDPNAGGAWDQAFAMAKDLLNLIAQGVNGGQLYDGWDGYYEHHGTFDYSGALRYDQSSGSYTPRSSFAVLGLFLQSLPPGTVHLDSDGAHAVRTEAFLDPATGKVTILGINPTASRQSFQLRIRGNFNSLRLQQLTSTANPSTSPQWTMQTGGPLAVSVAPDSVFSVVAS
ncbi:glycosyl hydrolase [Sinomonas sp. RB5]